MTQPDRKNDVYPTALCEEKRRLIEAFLQSNHALIALQNQQTQAVIDQDPDFARFDDLIFLAREKKDQAKYALISHVETHHC